MKTRLALIILLAAACSLPAFAASSKEAYLQGHLIKTSGAPAAWLDATHLVVYEGDRFSQIDITTGQQTPLLSVLSLGAEDGYTSLNRLRCFSNEGITIIDRSQPGPHTSTRVMRMNWQNGEVKLSQFTASGWVESDGYCRIAAVDASPFTTPAPPAALQEMADGNKVALHSRSISKEADKAWCEENFTPASISHGDYSEMITCKDNKKMIQRIPEDRKITYAGSEWNKCIDSAACNQSLIRTEEGMLSWFYPSQAVCFDRAVLRYRSAKGEIKDFPMDDGSPAVPLPPSCTQPFNYLFSIRDEATGKYLIYVHPTGFDPRNWYAHAWWFDPAVATLEPLVFPKGPWMRKDGFLRQLAHFETGCDGLRGMRLMAGRGKIFAGIAGKSECMDKDAGGIYALNEAKTAWVKMVPGEEPADIVNNVFGSYRQPLRGTAVPVLSADGCRIARKGNGGIAVFDVCGGNSSP